MSIDIRQFVDINIQYKETYNVSSTRPVTVLFTNEGTDNYKKLISSLSEFTDGSTMPNTLKYVKSYFGFGGNKLYIIGKVTDSTIQTVLSTLPNEYIALTYCKVDSSNIVENYTAMKTICKAYNGLSTTYGVNQKIFIANSSSVLTSAHDSDKIQNLAVKATNTFGDEMSIAAYLSNIDFYGTNTVHDYCFTSEDAATAVDLTTAKYSDLIEFNYNVDVALAGHTRNCGGNLKDGTDLVNQFSLIVLQQTLTDRVLTILTEKLKGESGLNAIYTTMSQELSKYVTNGYLSTDKTWTKPTLTVTKNSITYTIIEKDTQLLLGYKISILPLSSLTEDEKIARKTPYIYVVLADSYGIRKIAINGEVI